VETVYNFILNCWKLNKITVEDVESFAAKGFITSEQAEEILAVPKGR
jgi:hypothetical protein